jgi:hypothetical protein
MGVLSIDLQTRGLTMTATMTATVEPPAMEPAAVEFATVVSLTVELAAVESLAVEPLMESAEAFAAQSAIAEVRGITVASVASVASVIPPSVGTSRQAEGRNQKHAKDN